VSGIVCPILCKPHGWMTTIIKAFNVEDPRGHFCQATKASDGVEVKHRTLLCTLVWGYGASSPGPVPAISESLVGIFKSQAIRDSTRQ
jgi:hypothetical protein